MVFLQGGLVDPVIGLLSDPWKIGESYSNASGELSHRLLKIAGFDLFHIVPCKRVL